MTSEKTWAWKLKYLSSFASYCLTTAGDHYFASIDPQLDLKTDMI